MVERLVRVTQERDTPLDVLAACREVLPTCELVHVGENRWWLGYVKQTAAAEVGYLPPGSGRIQGELARQGFRWLGEYTDPFLSASYLRSELEFMFGRTDAELAEDMARVEARASGIDVEERKRELMQQRVHGEGRSIFAHVFRKRHSVLMPRTLKPTEAAV